MKLENVAPWGRSLREYELMFALTPEDRTARILGCGDGPASFNAELTASGGNVISVDPLYVFKGSQISQRFDETVDTIVSQMLASPKRWNWDFHYDMDGLVKNRRNALNGFLADFDEGLEQGRYRVGELPSLEFGDAEFDLALCSHFLFLYSDQFSEEFHMQSVLELLRVAREVRIFPLLNLAQELSPHLDTVQHAALSRGCECTIESVDYGMQVGGREMLRIKRES